MMRSNQKILIKREWQSIAKSELSASAWQELVAIAANKDKTTRYLTFISPECLKVRNFVGVITTKDGTVLEILPKDQFNPSSESLPASRALLFKMMTSFLKLEKIEALPSKVQKHSMPIIEALIATFLQSVNDVVHKGIRRDYQRIEAEEKFLKGQLQVARQLRQSPSKKHLFHIAYDVFNDDRAENRLIHSALIKVCRWSQNSANQRLGRELRFAFDAVPPSKSIKLDFAHWRTSRDMHYYQALLPWLRLILNEESPFATRDQHEGISFLFPMEQLFEAYVAKHLGSHAVAEGWRLKPQKQSHYLAKRIHKNGMENAFLLKPDLVLFEGQEAIAVMDTKWKLIDSSLTYEDDKPNHKAGISQSDLYQMLAYAMHYLHDADRRLVLIYPKTDKFKQPIEFDLSPNMELKGNCLTIKLTVMPFDLQEPQESRMSFLKN